MGEDFMMLEENNHHKDEMSWRAPIIHVDGPSGAPAQNYKDYKVLLLVVSTDLQSVWLNHHCLFETSIVTSAYTYAFGA